MNPALSNWRLAAEKEWFLLRRARENPELRLLGIEWANKYYMFAADRMARWGMTNVRIMRADARQFVIHNLPPECTKRSPCVPPRPMAQDTTSQTKTLPNTLY